MIDTTRKGNRKEAEVRKLLEKEGWETYKVSFRSRYITQDFLGLFDILGVQGRDRLYVQVKSTNSNLSVNAIILNKNKQGKSISDFVEKNMNIYEKVEVWIYRNGRWKFKKFEKGHWERYEIIRIGGKASIVEGNPIN